MGLKKLYIGRDVEKPRAGTAYAEGTVLEDRSELEELTIGPLVSQIYFWKFTNAPKLKKVTSYALIAPSINSSGKCSFEKYSDCVLYYPEGSDYSAWIPYFSKAIPMKQTDIDEVEITEKEEYCTPVYDLQGRIVSQDACSLETLPKGMYIVGGKKRLVK